MNKQAEFPADLAAIQLKGPALELLEQKRDGVGFLQAALERKLTEDAIAFAVQWLPRREAVWWGCLCAWHVLRQAPTPPAEAALKAAVQWVFDPKEETRRAAEAAGNATELGDPAGQLALAAFFSGGSIAPPEMLPVEAPPQLANETVGNALKLLLGKVKPDEKAACQEQFVKLAIDVSTGKLSWRAKSATQKR